MGQKKVAVVERFKQESMYELSAKKNGLCRELALVVQRLDSAIHWINHYPVDSAISFPNTYPLDSDLSGG